MEKKTQLRRLANWIWQAWNSYQFVLWLGGTGVIGFITRSVSKTVQESPIGWQIILYVSIALLFLVVVRIVWPYLPLPTQIVRTKVKDDKKSDVILPPQEIDLKNNSDWLLEVLAFNKQHVNTAVNGYILKWNFSGLKVIEDPFFEVHLRLFNTSIFTLDFKGVGGEIKVGGITCRTKPTANCPQMTIVQGTDFYVVVTQAVLPEMARKILEAGNNKEKLEFNLSQLTLNIETNTKGYEGLKPYIKFDSNLTPNIAIWLEIQDSRKVGYWT